MGQDKVDEQLARRRKFNRRGFTISVIVSTIFTIAFWSELVTEPKDPIVVLRNLVIVYGLPMLLAWIAAGMLSGDRIKALSRSSVDTGAPETVLAQQETSKQRENIGEAAERIDKAVETVEKYAETMEKPKKTDLEEEKSGPNGRLNS